MQKYLLEKLRRDYKNAIKDDIVIDSRVEKYIDYITKEIVDTTLKIDELNVIRKKNTEEQEQVNAPQRSMEYERYFGEMVLADKDKENRIAVAGKLEKVFKDFFLLVPILVAYANENSYELSDDRAVFIAENESNSLFNYDDLQQAILEGYTKKTWNTIIDKKTRNTHYREDGNTIDITEPFKVGDSEMMYPKDLSLGASAKETVNCRCSVTYS